MSEKMSDTRCIAFTQAGEPCKNKAKADSEYCHIHQLSSISNDSGNGSSVSVENRVLRDDELRRQLMTELDNLIARVQALEPDYEPPPFSPESMVQVMEEQTESMSPRWRLKILKRLRGSINEDLFDAETWKGIWYMVNYTLEYQGDILKRRLKGDYETDEWGLDWEYLEALRPFLDFLYKFYWRVETSGIENIPDYERALMVSNHSGQLAWDGAMIMAAFLNEHPAQRLVRNLYADWFPTMPFLSATLVKVGQALDSLENGTRLLEQDELVCVFPEGFEGVGKLFKDRYKLARFGHADFVRMSLLTQAPLVPVSVVGAEETTITLARSPLIARLARLPYFPISLRFPWFGLLGMIPLPTKWYIDIGEPIPTDEYGPEAADDPVLVSQLADKVRYAIQEMINNRVASRRSVFY